MTAAELAGHKAIVAKLGMDAHWRGAIVVANALREAGMEVVYAGHATADELVATVVEEDPALLGLSTLSGNHLAECAPVLAGLREAGVSDLVVVVGGTIPPADEARLAELGIDAVFGPGTPLRRIVARLGELIAAKRGRRAQNSDDGGQPGVG